VDEFKNSKMLIDQAKALAKEVKDEDVHKVA
jgi:hypothetical protein